MSITLCTIALNEEHFLPQMIEIVINEVDEVVVVDTGSSDGTYDVAAKAGAKVVRHPTSDLSEAKNVAIDHSSSDWVLNLDADERIDAQDFDLLRRVSARSNAAAIEFRFNNYVGKGDWAQLAIARFFRNLPALRYTGAYHESVYQKVLGADGGVEQSAVTVHHMEAFGPDISQFKRQRSLDRTRDYVAKNPSDVFRRCIIGVELFLMGQKEEGIQELEEALALNKDFGEAHSFLGQLYLHDGDWKTAEEHFKQASSLISKAQQAGIASARWRLPAHVGLASIAYHRGDEAALKNEVEECLRIDMSAATLSNAAHVAELTGDQEKSLQLYRDALKANRYLLDPVIYGPGHEFSIYRQQLSHLPGYVDRCGSLGFWRSIQESESGS